MPDVSRDPMVRQCYWNRLIALLVVVHRVTQTARLHVRRSARLPAQQAGSRCQALWRLLWVQLCSSTTSSCLGTRYSALLRCTGSCNSGTAGLNQQSEYVGCSRNQKGLLGVKSSSPKRNTTCTDKMKKECAQGVDEVSLYRAAGEDENGWR